jgi:hypothetical protein
MKDVYEYAMVIKVAKDSVYKYSENSINCIKTIIRFFSGINIILINII